MFRIFEKQCPKCKRKLKYRVPRKLFQKLIPYSKRFHCLHCYKHYLRIDINF